MKLRGTEYGNVLGASGVQGFYGEGYAFHRLLGPLGPNFDGMTFVSKTTPLDMTEGNMPLTENWRPKELFPKCIWIDFFKKIGLNAVALSGPGAESLLLGPLTVRKNALEKNPDVVVWQARTKPFVISFMPTAKTKEARLQQMRDFVELLKRFLCGFRGKVTLQINLSCPNVGLDLDQVLEEAGLILDIAAELGIPLMPKINLLVTPDAAIEIAKHKACDAICTTNTIPFGKMDYILDWKKMFPNGSPLAKFGGGGLSGEILFELVMDWVAAISEKGFEKPLNVGGGIMSKDDVYMLTQVGLRPGIDSIFLGSVAMLRPWRVQGIIKYANSLLAA